MDQKVMNKLDWDTVMFSDEKRWNLDGPDGFQYYWHDLRKEPQYLSKRAFGGGSTMTWAGIGSNSKTEIAFLDTSMDSQCYIDTLDEYLLHANRSIFAKN
jgi:hypothetical protein